jgi:hypothetical protein
MGFEIVRRFVESRQVKRRAKLAEDVLFGAANVKVDKEIADATARLTEALCRNNSVGAVDCGMFVFIKLRESHGAFMIVAKRLTVDERIGLNEKHDLLYDPRGLAEWLGISGSANSLAKN